LLVAHADNFHFHDARVLANKSVRNVAAGYAMLTTVVIIALVVGLPTEKELFESKPPHESAPRRTRRTTMLLAIFTLLSVFIITVLVGNAVEKDTNETAHRNDSNFLLRGMVSGVLAVFVLLFAIYTESRIWDGVAIFQVGHSMFSVLDHCVLMKNVQHYDQAATGFAFLTILLIVLFVASLLHAEPGYTPDSTGGHTDSSYQSAGAATTGASESSGLTSAAF